MTVNVIAIDGPAASGKSSTAAAVARALGWVHIDSGALYRALTWVAVTANVWQADDIVAAADQRQVALRRTGDELRLHIAGVADPESAIRSTAVEAAVSQIAALPVLRVWVNTRLRAAAAAVAGAVIDGRDIGTVVIPDARLKIYLVAAPAVRAERRLRQQGDAVDPALLAAETATLADRDTRDASRTASPLRQAPDAIVIDTTALTFDEQVDRIVTLARDRAV